MFGPGSRQREGPGEPAGVLLQRGAARGAGAAAARRRRSLPRAPPRGPHARLPVRARAQSHPQDLPRVRAGQRVRARAGQAPRGGQRRLRRPLHLLAADVRHRGAVSGPGLAGQQRGVQGGDARGRVHAPAQSARAAHQGGGEEAHPGVPQGQSGAARLF